MAKKKNPVMMFGHEVSCDVGSVLKIISLHPRHMHELAIELGMNDDKVANILRDIRKTFGRESIGKRDGFYFIDVRTRQKER